MTTSLLLFYFYLFVRQSVQLEVSMISTKDVISTREKKAVVVIDGIVSMLTSIINKRIGRIVRR